MNFGSYIPMADRKILAMFEVLSNRLDQMENGVSILWISTECKTDKYERYYLIHWNMLSVY